MIDHVLYVQRFYDPEDGCIRLDQHDIRDCNLHWLRSIVSTVSQEPVLFAMSVADNIRYGAQNYGSDPVSEPMIEAAARTANAHDFVSAFPEGYDTLVSTFTTAPIEAAS